MLICEGPHNLVLVDRDSGALEVQARELPAGSVEDLVQLDVTEPDAVREKLGTVSESFHPHILINGVGGDTRVIGYADLEVSHFQQTYIENVIGTFSAIKAVAPQMAADGYGRIVNFASAGGRTYSHFNNAAYVGAKAAVIGMTKQIAYELAESGVVANVVAHGPIATSRVAGAWERRDPKQKDEVLSKLPMRRMGSVEEAAGSVLHFASESAGYTTGAVLDVNGGVYM
ncbi:MAG: SDR family oxidoreductase [Kocuria rhizophila]|nr:MAG: SDR family oxidoreductase [Kocuria rhizophila]